MDMTNYMDAARMEGYDICFTGIGMGYVALRAVALTEIMDVEKAENQLALIGMAIINDDVRKMLRKG